VPEVLDYNASIAKIYDRYFDSNCYSLRYPKYNIKSLSMILDTLVNIENPIVLDYGCGNGRYSFPLLKETNSSLFLFDISTVAFKQFHASLNAEYKSRVTTLSGNITELYNIQDCNTVICMFGVLSHIPNSNKRLEVLKTFYDIIKVGGSLVISVPNMSRRFLVEQIIHYINRKLQHPRVPATETGDIIYKRKINNFSEKIFYHLYSKKSFMRDIKESGFKIKTVSAESFLPEKYVVSSSFFRVVDKILMKIFPSFLGYGIICVAEKEV
jgi:SAM-dependent methyltransferase